MSTNRNPGRLAAMPRERVPRHRYLELDNDQRRGGQVIPNGTQCGQSLAFMRILEGHGQQETGVAESPHALVAVADESIDGVRYPGAVCRVLSHPFLHGRPLAAGSAALRRSDRF